MPPSPPQFAVVGRINKGKSSILATLVEESDNARIRISATPGETTHAQHIPLVINGETLIEFIDTPGFTNAAETLAWLKAHHPKNDTTPRIDTVRAFVDEHRGQDRFTDECELLTPILAGAGIIYIVDASKPFRPDFLDEMEILRWTGRPRLALINNLSDDADFTDDWKKHLGESFNLTREFNAHHARFPERIRLLRQLLEIEDDRKPVIEKTVRLLEDEWEQRRGEAADIILDLLDSCLRYRAVKNVAAQNVTRDFQKKKAAEEIKSLYIDEIKKREAAGHDRLTKLYKHNAPDSETDSPDDNLVDPADLFAEETWQFLGLTKWQLAVAGAITGGAAGAGIDIAAGGTALGIPAALGAAAGLTASLLKGRSLANIKVDLPFLPGAKASPGGAQLSAGPSRNPNFPWILLDRALSHLHQLLLRAHGRRDPFIIQHQRSGYTSKLDAHTRRTLQKHFHLALKNKPTPDTNEIFQTLTKILQTVEDGQPPPNS
ncbi:MAG: GTPase/DUF3482 domain-containing protein [Verrucomicrobiota bacterium]